jgi:hypothetical protein
MESLIATTVASSGLEPRQRRANRAGIDSTVEGASWHVQFASLFAPALESELDTGSAMLPLTLADTPAALSDDTFECFVRE